MIILKKIYLVFQNIIHNILLVVNTCKNTLIFISFLYHLQISTGKFLNNQHFFRKTSNLFLLKFAILRLKIEALINHKTAIRENDPMQNKTATPAVPTVQYGR